MMQEKAEIPFVLFWLIRGKILQQPASLTKRLFLILYLAIAILVAWLKYNLHADKISLREYGTFLLDVSLDCITVGGTILVAYCHLIATPSAIFWNSILLILSLVIGLFIRRKYIDGDIISTSCRIISVVISCLLCCASLIYLFINICTLP